MATGPNYLSGGITPTIAALAATACGPRHAPSFPADIPQTTTTLVKVHAPRRTAIVDKHGSPAQPGCPSPWHARHLPDPFWWDEAEPSGVRPRRRAYEPPPCSGRARLASRVPPHDWKMYDKKFLADQGLDQVRGWLDRQPAERPPRSHLYCDEVDTWGHNTGPRNSPR